MDCAAVGGLKQCLGRRKEQPRAIGGAHVQLEALALKGLSGKRPARRSVGISVGRCGCPMPRRGICPLGSSPLETPADKQPAPVLACMTHAPLLPHCAHVLHGLQGHPRHALQRLTLLLLDDLGVLLVSSRSQRGHHHNDLQETKGRRGGRRVRLWGPQASVETADPDLGIWAELCRDGQVAPVASSRWMPVVASR